MGLGPDDRYPDAANRAALACQATYSTDCRGFCSETDATAQPGKSRDNEHLGTACKRMSWRGRPDAAVVSLWLSDGGRAVQMDQSFAHPGPSLAVFSGRIPGLQSVGMTTAQALEAIPEEASS